MDSLGIPQIKRAYKASETYRIGTPPPVSPPLSRAFPADSIRPSVDVSDVDSESSGDDDTVQVLFNRIYIDPRQEVMDMLDDQAGSILRTGKITVAGETGGRPLVFFGNALARALRIKLDIYSWCTFYVMQFFRPILS